MTMVFPGSSWLECITPLLSHLVAGPLALQTYQNPYLPVQVLFAGLLQGGCKMQICSP